MFEDFAPRQLECLSTYSELIPGALDMVAALRQQQPARLIIAVPMAAVETCEALRAEVDGDVPRHNG